MKLSRIAKEIPAIRDEEDGTYPLDDESDVEKELSLKKRLVHRPQQAMAGELNKDIHTPISPTSFTGAATTR